MKHLINGALFVAFSLCLLSHTATADVPVGTVQDYSQSSPANGKVVQFDLDGDGKKESISLVSLWQAKDGRSSAYRLKVNGVTLDEIWDRDDIAGNVKVEGFVFGDLNTRDRSKEIVVGGPADDNVAFKIYAWRDGKIRRVLRAPIFIERFNGDGTITEVDYYGWAEVRRLHRLNAQGELKLVKKSSYPLRVYGSSTNNKPALILKSVFFRVQPDARSLAFEVPKGSTVIFDRMTSDEWAGAIYKGRRGWVRQQQVNEDSETFGVTRAG